MLTIPANLRHLAKLCPTEYPRYPKLCGVLIQETAVGYQAVATDDRRLGIVEGAEENTRGGYFNPEEQEAVIAAKDLDRVLKTCKMPKHKNGERPMAHLSMGKEESMFLAGLEGADKYGIKNLTEGRWPPHGEVVKQMYSAFSVVVDGRLLAELLETAAAFSLDDSGAVTLHFGPSTKSKDPSPYVIVTTKNDHQKFQGCLLGLP